VTAGVPSSSRPADFGSKFLASATVGNLPTAAEPWGAHEVLLDLPGGPYRVSGLAERQVVALAARFAAEVLDSGVAALELRLARDREGAYRQIDTRGWEYHLEIDAGLDRLTIAGLRLRSDVDLGGAAVAVPLSTLWTPDEGGPAFAGIVENVLRVVVAYRLLATGALLVHCAAVRLGQHAVIALGASGAGKTTFSRFAESEGATVLSDDLNALRHVDGQLFVERLPFTGDLGTRSGSSDPIPVGAVLRLAHSGQHQLVPLTRAEVVGSLVACAPFVNVDRHRQLAVLDRAITLLGAPTPTLATLHFALDGGFWAILREVCARSGSPHA
jgi:hypothetical protein